MNRNNNNILSLIIICIVFSTILLNASPSENRTIHPNLSFGIAYPQIPLSQFRPPIGVTGNLGMQWRFLNKWAFHVSGSGLKTFNFGTVTSKKATLKFNVLWISADLKYAINDNFQKVSFVSAGTGYYHLNRQLDRDMDEVTTPGLCLGFSHNTSHRKHSTIFEIRWHLLFKPEDNPQILTITYGFLL